MSEIYEKNSAIIELRWPALFALLKQQDISQIRAELVEGQSSTLKINGIQLTSRHYRDREAEQQAASVVAAPVLYLYGTGLGELPRELLKRHDLQQLQIHLLNESLFVLVLHVLDQRDWLSDPRVELHCADEYKEIQTPFFAHPAELLLCNDRNSKIRDRLVVEIELPFVNRRFSVDNPDVLRRLQSNMALVQQDSDVATLFNTCRGWDAYVIAAGPTLTLHYEKLQKLQKERAVIICVDTALTPLLTNGIIPDYVVCIDEAINRRHFPADVPSSIPLIYFPMVAHETLISWHGKRYSAYSSSPVYEQMRQTTPRATLYSYGSVIHPSVDFAVQLGVDNVILLGADFSFPMDKTHAGWADGELAESITTATHWVLNGYGERVKTFLNFRSFICGLERYIARHPEVHFFNTSRLGAVIDGTTYLPEFTQ